MRTLPLYLRASGTHAARAVAWMQGTTTLC